MANAWRGLGLTPRDTRIPVGIKEIRSIVVLPQRAAASMAAATVFDLQGVWQWRATLGNVLTLCPGPAPAFTQGQGTAAMPEFCEFARLGRLDVGCTRPVTRLAGHVDL